MDASKKMFRAIEFYVQHLYAKWGTLSEVPVNIDHFEGCPYFSV